MYKYKGVEGVNGATTTKVGSVDNNGKSIAYSYDANGNIKTITEDNKVITYNYNEVNELKREDNQVLGKTIVYSYDAGGNLQNKVEYPYTDQLTYGGYTYSWKWGRQLASMLSNEKTISYKYNYSVIRTYKTVNDITTNYHLVVDKVTYEDNGADKIYYIYGSSVTVLVGFFLYESYEN